MLADTVVCLFGAVRRSLFLSDAGDQVPDFWCSAGRSGMENARDLSPETPALTGFQTLASSRIAWLQEVLKPWCQQACRGDLLLAEHEWLDLAGKVDPAKTLWAWAWSRFPALIHEELGIDESCPVTVRLADGRKFAGYPDARNSRQGRLVLIGTAEAGGLVELGPFVIDEISSIERELDPR
jgi:hypothetical protein